MKIVGVIVILVLSTFLCFITLKIISWMMDYDKKTDEKWFHMEFEDYENDKKCAIASAVIVNIFITVAIVYLFLTRW